jgi:hypothetical protein
MPQRALDLARSNPVRALSDSVQPASLGRQAWQATGGRVAQGVEASSEGLAGSGRLTGLRQASSSLALHGSQAIGSALRGDLSTSGMRLKDMGGDLQRLYDLLRRRETKPDSRSQEA